MSVAPQAADDVEKVEPPSVAQARTGRNGRPILTIASAPLQRVYRPEPSDEFDPLLKAIVDGGS